MLMIIDEVISKYSKAFVFYLTTPDNDYYYSKELTLLFSFAISTPIGECP